MSEVKEPQRRGLAEVVDPPVTQETEPVEAEDTEPYERLSNTVVYVVNLSSGTIHRYWEENGKKRSFHACNLKAIARAKSVKTREEITNLFWPRRKPVGCRRCFPPPTPEEEAEAAEVEVEETPDPAVLKA